MSARGITRGLARGELSVTVAPAVDGSNDATITIHKAGEAFAHAHLSSTECRDVAGDLLAIANHLAQLDPPAEGWGTIYDRPASEPAKEL